MEREHSSFGGGEAPHIKGLGMLVVLLRGVNFGFWSHSVLGKTLLYLAVKISFRVARAKILKYVYCLCFQ